jgi:hypothetical protein
MAAWQYTIENGEREYIFITLFWYENNSDQFNSISWGGVRLSPLVMLATIWPIVPAPDRWWGLWTSRWKENWQGKPKYSDKTCSSATLTTANNIWPDLGSNPGRRGGKPATNHLSYNSDQYRSFMEAFWRRTGALPSLVLSCVPCRIRIRRECIGLMWVLYLPGDWRYPWRFTCVKMWV